MWDLRRELRSLYRWQCFGLLCDNPQDAQVAPELHGRPRQRQSDLPSKLTRGPELLVAPRVALVMQCVLSASRVSPAQCNAGSARVCQMSWHISPIFVVSLVCVCKFLGGVCALLSPPFQRGFPGLSCFAASKRRLSRLGVQTS